MRFRRAVHFLAIAMIVLGVARMLTRNTGGRTHLPPADPLAVRVPEMHIASANLSECVAKLSQTSGVQIVLDPALGDPSIYKLDFDAPPSTLHKDIEALCSSCAISAAAFADGARVRVVAAGMQPRTLRIYDVRDIWSKTTAEFWQVELLGNDTRSQNGPYYGGQGMFGGSSYLGAVRRNDNPPSWPASQADAMDDIVEVVCSTVTPEEWEQNGGTSSIHGASGYLVVYHTAQGQRGVENLLAAIRAASDIRWPSDNQKGGQ